MVAVERTLTVAGPVEEVVRYLQDFSRTEEWDPGTVSCTRLDEGEVREGATWRNVSRFRGRTTELTYRLVRLEAQRLTFVGENKTVTSVDDLTFRPAADGSSTTLTYRADLRFKGLARLAAPFLRRDIERLGDEVARQLPEVLARR
ncbi:SRPBCC family protein [Streptacidiphilus sp. ASG 303]|uniref:SRPBCC family protein n=1 Tax=Streptomycetaceae TaxID=2062 RepID=UPI001E33DC14|nr:SRPBCC family protein [Streptacidiphilus sp. ASG 303]MCD0480882.1 SRPBCC family protein [Streptacidiphilus sp. ASG 303]